MRPNPPHLALALVALIAFPLTASETKGPPGEKPAAPAAEAAMKATIDPATGQLVSRPDPSTRAALTATPARALPALKVEKGTTKAGGKRVRLDDRFMMEMTVAVGPDGKVSKSCVAEHEKPAPAPAAAKEHLHDR